MELVKVDQSICSCQSVLPWRWLSFFYVLLKLMTCGDTVFYKLVVNEAMYCEQNAS